MSGEGYYYDEPDVVGHTLDAAVTAAEVLQMPDGRAGLTCGAGAGFAASDRGTFQVTGVWNVAKTTGINLLAGGRVYWDASANKAHYKKVNDADFYLGTCAKDAAASDTYCLINANVAPTYDISLQRDGFLSVPTGTQVVGAFGFPKVLGGSHQLQLTATNEAQCVDLLSRDKFAVATPAIAEFTIVPDANGSTSDVDASFGIANGTSTTDADAITESVFLHIDGGSANLLVESDDGTTEVNATDTTLDLTAGSAVANRVELWIDKRDNENIKVYINGVRVLDGTTGAATTLKLDAATGPLGLLAHLEKASGTATGKFTLDHAAVRYSHQ